MDDTIENSCPDRADAAQHPPDIIWADVICDGFTRPDLPWQPWSENGREGVDICPIFTTQQTGDGGAAALLVRFRPGAHGDFHEHLGFELMLVLDVVVQGVSWC